VAQAEHQRGGATTYLLPDDCGESTALLGFYGHMEYGAGMMVDRVLRGTPAWRLGLERGDLIVRINGRSFRTERDFARLLRAGGHRVRLHIEDVHTGRVLLRTAHLEHDHDDYDDDYGPWLHEGDDGDSHGDHEHFEARGRGRRTIDEVQRFVDDATGYRAYSAR
jgi:hypothetical protein